MTLNELAHNLRSNWKRLLAADLVFKSLAFIFLWPMVSVLFRWFVAVSGREVLADADMAKFLLHPIGAFTFVVVGGSALALIALEQSVLMTLAMTWKNDLETSLSGAFRIAARKGLPILELAIRIVAELALWAIPFLAASGSVYWLLLTKHDINFYLATTPAEFWLASVLISSCLIACGFTLACRLCNYVYSLPILLFEGASPRDALQQGRQLVRGNRLRIAAWLAAWAVTCSTISVLITILVGWVARPLVTRSSGSVVALSFSVGAALAMVTVGNLISNAFTNGSLSAMLATSYASLGRNCNAGTLLSERSRATSLERITLTVPRMLSALLIGVLAAGLLGATILESFELEDSAVVTAHRGGATASPENTLAAIEHAILQDADWIEVDVQESRDGVVLVVHDSDLKRVSGNPVKIWETDSEVIRAIDIGSYHGERFSDQRVPTLEEVLVLCKDRVNVNIELKYYGHSQRLEEKVVELVESADMEDEVVVMSLKQKGINKIKELRPNWTCGLLTAVAAGDLTRADADFLAVNRKLATKPFVDLAHQRGKEVAVWTLNDRVSVSTMLSRGVDNVITDDPALVRDVLQERADLNPTERLMVELAVFFGVQPTSPEVGTAQDRVGGARSH